MTTTARLHHVGVTSSFTMATRKALAAELEPLAAGTRWFHIHGVNGLRLARPK